jgi:hypothetical protein
MGSDIFFASSRLKRLSDDPDDDRPRSITTITIVDKTIIGVAKAWLYIHGLSGSNGMSTFQ